MLAEISAGIVTTGAWDSLRCDGGTLKKGPHWTKKEPGAAYDRSNTPKTGMSNSSSA
jgi:hypothetical protein